MKKLVVYLTIVLLFGAIFGAAVQNISCTVKQDAPIISSTLEFFAPAVAYADSDTANGFDPKPPPPPPID